MKLAIFSLIVTIALFIASCNEAKEQSSDRIKKRNQEIALKVHKIIIQPLGKVDNGVCVEIYNKVSKVLLNVKLNKSKVMPPNAYYPSRNRFRADSILTWLKMGAKADEKWIAITQVDISTSKGKKVDFGVIGLAYSPGSACIASNFRIKDKDHFDKVVLHELAHNFGLPHCSENTCYMRDYNAEDLTTKLEGFCDNCEVKLVAQGWKL